MRSRQLKSPLIFAANIPLTYFNAMGMQFYAQIGKSLTQQRNITKPKDILVANTVSANMSIEQRAERLAVQIKKAYEANGGKRMHLVTHSFAGIDARCALSLFGMDKYVRSLTTLCSPHRGCALISEHMKRPQETSNIHQMEKTFEVLGMSLKNAEEFHHSNMEAFNQVATDAQEVDYYSFGAKKKELQMSELLRPGYEIITNHEIMHECDGMNRVSDTKWARYLLTFDHDHFDVVGFNPNVNP